MIHHGDCVEVMAGMDPESVDAIVCDPPYGLEFMGKEWDKPSAMLGSFESASRVRVKLPDGKHDGFGRRPSGSARVPIGYSEGHQGVAYQAWSQQWAEAAYRVARPSAYLLAFGGTRTVHRMTVALEDAGWIIRDMLVWAYASGFPKSKASLKPAWEPIVMARKPGPLRMLAIDECRITGAPPSVPQPVSGFASQVFGTPSGRNGEMSEASGRWPANVLLTDPIFDGGVEGVVGGGESAPSTPFRWNSPRQVEPTVYGGGAGIPFDEAANTGGYGDSGTYSRFFLIPKAARADREPIIGRDGIARVNVHPTVKSTDLMRHLVRLVTPTGGVVLDPFLGSGTTALAAEMEGFAWIGIEREAEYVAIAEARLNGTQRGLGLDTPAPTPRMPNTHPDLSKHQPKQRAPGDNYSGRWAGTPAEEEAS